MSLLTVRVARIVLRKDMGVSNPGYGEYTIYDCILIYTYVVTEPAFQYEGGVRLVGGPYSSEGILEVFIFNTWYTICTESLSEDAATAVCTQLGYTNNVRTTRRFESKFITSCTLLTIRSALVLKVGVPCASRSLQRQTGL